MYNATMPTKQGYIPHLTPLTFTEHYVYCTFPFGTMHTAYCTVPMVSSEPDNDLSGDHTDLLHS